MKIYNIQVNEKSFLCTNCKGNEFFSYEIKKPWLHWFFWGCYSNRRSVKENTLTCNACGLNHAVSTVFADVTMTPVQV